MQEYEPRIIARGEWTQDENGDTVYIPTHRRPQTFRQEAASVTGWGDLDEGRETNGAPFSEAVEPDSGSGSGSAGSGGGYRIRSDAVWEQARADFLAGDAATAVCDRYGVSLGAFRSRAAREGWRRSDQPDPESFDPAAFDADTDTDAEPAVSPPDIEAMAAQALIRARRAIHRGRAGEAATWLRVHRQLARLAPAAYPEPPPPPEPDPLHLLTLKMKAAAEVARAAAALQPDNAQGHAAIGELLAELKSMPVAAPTASISDDSDDSDSVFSDPPDRIDPPPDSEE